MREIDAQLSQRLDCMTADLWRLLIEGGGMGDIMDCHGAVAVRSPVPTRMLNGVNIAKVDRDKVKEVISSLRCYYDKQAWRWDVGPSSEPKDLRETLSQAGLTHAYDYPGMALEIVANQWQRDPQVVEVKDDHGLREWLQMVDVFAMPPESANAFAELHLKQGWEMPLRYFLVRADGRPVAFSMICVEGDVAGIYCVGTHADYRRRGLGRLVTEECLAAADEMGCRHAVLQSSSMGLPVYPAMGFREICTFSRFHSDAPD